MKLEEENHEWMEVTPITRMTCMKGDERVSRVGGAINAPDEKK